jgi:hypothetical protein
MGRDVDPYTSPTIGDRILESLASLSRRIYLMSLQLDTLTAEVAQNTTVVGSAVALIQGFSARLQAAIDAGADPVALQALADELNNSNDALAAAVAANTPAEPPVP